MQHDAKWARRAQRELRDLLNEWDPLGVFDPDDDDHNLGVVDEYDCIRDPLIAHLLRGDSRTQVAEFLRDELRGHFGLEPSRSTTHFIDRVFEWWESAR